MKRLTGYLKEKRGMTLVETLTALTILALIIFCFAPLYLSYFNTIKISGNKLKATYTEAGKLQSLIGGKGTGANSGYESNVSSIPLVFNSPETVVTQDGVTETIQQTEVAVKTAANPNGKIDPIGGSFIFSNPTDIKAGFSTIYTNSINSNIKCFPTSLTDDFVTAYITIVADGFNFSNDNMNDLNAYSLYCTKANSANNGSELKQLVFNKDYTLERVSGTQNILLLTLYGGTDVSYENSPLVFNYNNGAYTKEIEVDAPTMIMVGEKATDGKYYYYVSRGEVDDDGNLIILRRTMNSKDPKTGTNVTLTSAMNDVEWVPAESGDGRNKDSDDEKYGYYVMCGDNGQIRRFWRNNATGNYYWGGDYTYYTDAKFDKVNSSYFVNGTNTYSTDVSYKFSFRANAGSNGKGFNLSTNSSNYLQSVNIWSITAFGDNTNGRVSAFWGSDGRMFYYQRKKKNSVAVTPLYDAVKNNDFGDNKSERLVNGQQSQTWLNGSKDNYYELTGADTNENPITLTSVDAIVLSGYSVGAGDGYYWNVGKSDESYLSEWGCYPNVNYPTTSYTLYCGYIPASMDLWTTKSSPNGSFSDSMAKSDGGSYTDVSTLYLDRVSNSIKDSAIYPMWKGTLGITPYLTRANILTGQYTLEVKSTGSRAYYNYGTNWAGIAWDNPHEYIEYYPYENLDYALTGKFYDGSIFEKEEEDKKMLLSVVAKNTSKLVPTANLSYSAINGKQQYMTNGKVVDITMAYLSHPYAIHAGANPTDDTVYDMSNDKGNKIFYWNNMRETITFLDCASTVIPNGNVDIPVSLMVGYVMGGMAEFDGDNTYANTIMNNGIVFLRSGSAWHGTQSSDNAETEEYYAKDKTGYKLNSESNVFHQFYYLNSRTPASDGNEPYRDPVGVNKHIGNLYGANYWQNNRHIDYVSMNGGKPGTGYNYLRCHPMSNTKVNCVAWGTTWNNNPEAMWGTENGTVLSWWVDLNEVKKSSTDSKYWNDRSVAAELQSYRWVDNVNGKTFAVEGNSWKGTVGSAVDGSGSAAGTVFSPSNNSYNEFFDKGSREMGKRSAVGTISVLNSINDVAHDNDFWIAGGDQSGKDPADYSGTGSFESGNASLGTKRTIKAYTGDGKGGSWIYVRYWVDMAGDGTQSDSNHYYHWKAVKISNDPWHNVVQVNNINGMWIATGYVDSNHNGEQDDGEKTVVSWATDPLAACGEEGGWSEKAVFYEYNGNGGYTDVTNSVGGINSVATRS